MEKENKNGIGRILIVIVTVLIFIAGSFSSLYFYLGFLKDSNNIIIKKTMIGHRGYTFNMPNDIYFIQKENMIEITDNNSWFATFQITEAKFEDLENIDFEQIFNNKEINIKENQIIKGKEYKIIEVKDIDEETQKEINVLYAYTKLSDEEIAQIYATNIEFSKPSYEALEKVAGIIASKNDSVKSNIKVEVTFPKLDTSLPDIIKKEERINVINTDLQP